MKALLTVLCFTGISFFVLSCASNSSVRVDVPDFVRNPPKDKDLIYGVGSAKMANDYMSKTMAENRARVAITQKLSSIAKTMIEDYSAQVEGDKSTFLNFSDSVNRTLSQAKLSNTEIVEELPATDGTWWVLMSMKKSDADKDLSTVFDREKLNYAAFQNWNAQREMDAAFARQSTQSPVIVDR
ncbi:MAG: LPP20 family lipoprotein [Spirochaetaceae bacterium]|jgi:hypothetical protein|nr:LPP20 family lipoprotein [Spirochaetaceae bacterium]